MNTIFRCKGYFLFLLGITAIACTGKAPMPVNPVPSETQWQWHGLEQYMFVHFGPNTFTGVEWGDGKEQPAVFNPTDLDCRQWAHIAKEAGMKAIIITAKHHDGFCLWPSQYSTHTVRESPWKNGQGDVLRELSDACAEYGLLFGVYLSPWDQNHPAYGTPEYNQVFANTLTEVLGNYGAVFEQWFDGACGEGLNGKRQVYDWALFNNTVKKLQPDIVIFSDVGPDCRWTGNERGEAGETNWAMLNTEGFTPGAGAPPAAVLNSGEIDGKYWIPAEVDVSIRPGWFYSPLTDDKVKPLAQLMKIYYESVGRGSNLLLNVPPDHRGRIHPNDSARLMEWKHVIEQSFADNLAKNARVKASNTRRGKFSARHLTDGEPNTYWAAKDQSLSAGIEIDLGVPKAFNHIVLQEYIRLGQRVKNFSISYLDGTEWKTLDTQTTIGYKRILCFPMIKAQKIKVDITDARACPVLSEIAVYKAIEVTE